MGPLPSRKGCTITRFRCAIAARMRSGAEDGAFSSSARAFISAGTSSIAASSAAWSS